MARPVSWFHRLPALARTVSDSVPAQELAGICAQGKPAVVRRKLRELIRRDYAACDTPLPQRSSALGYGMTRGDYSVSLAFCRCCLRRILQ